MRDMLLNQGRLSRPLSEPIIILSALPSSNQLDDVFCNYALYLTVVSTSFQTLFVINSSQVSAEPSRCCTPAGAVAARCPWTSRAGSSASYSGSVLSSHVSVVALFGRGHSGAAALGRTVVTLVESQ